MQRIVVLGATSTIARHVLNSLAERKLELCLVGRNQSRLDFLRTNLLSRGACEVCTVCFDMSAVEQLPRLFASVADRFPCYDTVLLCYGTMLLEGNRNIDALIRQLNLDFVSAAALLTLFAQYFETRREGCIAAITSVAGDRGRRSNYVYGAAKGGLSLFLQGLRQRLHPSGVRVITIKPGPVRTALTEGFEPSFLLSDPERVGKQICCALEKRGPDIVYAPRYWRLVMLAMTCLPEWLFKRLKL